MTAVNSQSKSTIHYPDRTIKRAARAMRCAPFLLNFYATMFQQSVELNAIAGESGVQNYYTHTALAEFATENELLWLIQVGVLRREVDGQGITDSFRLTPLGRRLTEKAQQSARGTLTAPTLRDRLYNALNRWLRVLF